MSVALSNGASVVAFIGLAGEALRGVLFLYDLVEDIKDAPGQLKTLYQDLMVFQLSLAAFHETTKTAASLGTPTNLPTLTFTTNEVLKDAAVAIKPVLLVFQKYGKGRATPMRKRISVALNRKKISKYSRRLGQSSSLIINTNANISMMNITFQHQNSSGQANVASATFLVDVAQRFTTLENAIQAATTCVLNTFVDICSKIEGLPDIFALRMENHLSDLPVISDTTRKALLIVQNSSQDTRGFSDQLSLNIERVVRDTVQQAVLEAVDKLVTTSDIEKIMRQVLLDHELQITKSDTATSQLLRASVMKHEREQTEPPTNHLNPLYVHIVYESANHTCKAFSLDVSTMQTDQEFFEALKKAYILNRFKGSCWKRNLSWRQVSDIRSVIFEFFPSRSLVDIQVTDIMYEYQYSQTAAKVPPPPPYILLYLYNSPRYATGDYRLASVPRFRFPLGSNDDGKTHILSGLRIVEGLDCRKMAVFCFSLLIALTILIGVLATVYDMDISSSFTIGSYTMATIALGTTTIQILLPS